MSLTDFNIFFCFYIPNLMANNNFLVSYLLDQRLEKKIKFSFKNKVKKKSLKFQTFKRYTGRVQILNTLRYIFFILLPLPYVSEKKLKVSGKN
jgi:hypothetical protein